MGHFQQAVDHACAAGETHGPTNRPEAGKAVHDFAQTAAVELADLGKIQHDAGAILADEFIEGQLELLALDAHLQRAA